MGERQRKQKRKRKQQRQTTKKDKRNDKSKKHPKNGLSSKTNGERGNQEKRYLQKFSIRLGNTKSNFKHTNRKQPSKKEKTQKNKPKDGTYGK